MTIIKRRAGHGFNSHALRYLKSIYVLSKTCNICNISKSVIEFPSNGNSTSGAKKYKPSCKSCYNSSIRDSKSDKIDQILKEFGRPLACEMCGYCKNRAALTFHHIDSYEKDFSIANRRTTSYETLKKEIDKCVLLCHNCHMEEHYPHLNME